MKQVEITVRVMEDIETAIKKLEKLGFENIRESDVNDIYMSQNIEQLDKKNIQAILSSSVILRSLKLNNEEIKKITYKNKTYNNGEVVSETKVNVICDNLEKAQKLFECVKFEKLVQVKYHVLVMAKDEIEFAFQNVEGLGLLIEYENKNDFEESSFEQIKEEKKRMYNILRETGIKITEEYDVKKAIELINNIYFK